MRGKEYPDLLAAFDDAPLGGQYWTCFALISVGLALEYFDFYIVGFLVAVLGPQWHLTYGQSSLMLLSAGVGAIVGALCWGAFADVWGRKRLVVWGQRHLRGLIRADRLHPQPGVVAVCLAALRRGLRTGRRRHHDDGVDRGVHTNPEAHAAVRFARGCDHGGHVACGCPGGDTPVLVRLAGRLGVGRGAPVGRCAGRAVLPGVGALAGRQGAPAGGAWDRCWAVCTGRRKRCRSPVPGWYPRHRCECAT